MGQPNRSRERGGSKLNTLLTLLILGAFIFSAIEIVPAYFANYQLQDAMQSEARFAVANKKGDEEIRDDIWKKVQELNIPARKEDIRISLIQGALTISLDYSVPVDLKVTQFKLEFHPHADNQTI